MSEVMNVLGDECRGDECRTILMVLRETLVTKEMGMRVCQGERMI